MDASARSGAATLGQCWSRRPGPWPRRPGRCMPSSSAFEPDGAIRSPPSRWLVKLTVLGWHGLTKDEDYLWGRGQPWSPTRPAPWNFQAGHPQNVDDADAPPTCPQENKSRGRGQVNSPSTAFIFRTCDKTAPNRPHPRSRHDSELFLRLVSFLRHPGFAQALDRPVRRFEKARVAAPIGDPGLEPFPC
jgi:hypothetical protein